MIMNVFRTIEPISWMLWPKWETKHRSKQGLQCRIQTLRWDPAPPRAPPGDLATDLSIPYQSLLAPIQESPGFWIPRRGFRIPGTGFQSFSMELGFWIPIVGGISDSLSCIPNPHAKISQITPHSLTRGDMVIKILFAGQTVKSIYAVYDQNAGDRRWNIQCVYNKAAQICKWSSYYHTSFKYECQGFISGKYNPITY